MSPHLIKRLFKNASASVLAANAHDYGDGKPAEAPYCDGKAAPARHGSESGQSITPNENHPHSQLSSCETDSHTTQSEMPESISCKQCGLKFTASPSRGRKYCSQKCAYESSDRVAHVVPKERGTSICHECRIQFKITSRSGLAKFCSRKCSATHAGKKSISVNRRLVKKTKEVQQKCVACGGQFRSWVSGNRKYCSTACASNHPALKTARVTTYRNNGNKGTLYSRCPKGWMEVGGKRIFCRSTWEAKYALYLEWLKTNGQIFEWEHEPKTFWFDKIKRGVRSYLPDFRISISATAHEWHEVKGWMDSKSKTKLRRMKKYHPMEIVRVIDGRWFKHANKTIAKIVPNWNAPLETEQVKVARFKEEKTVIERDL